jgi:uncharacterized protein (UPF0332 family)
MEERHKELFIKISLEKSQEAMKFADIAIKENAYTTALNRIYYAIFYVVTALGYKFDYTTSKHIQLKGWFNKKFVYEETIFTPELYEIYNTAFENRQESDYKMTYVADEEFVKELFVKAKTFIEQVEKAI